MSRKHFFKNSGESVIPNTFIGGVGATYITSAAEMAAVTSLSEGDILGFSIDGSNNVSFRVEVTWGTSGTNRFDNLLEMTYFIDLDGYYNGSMTWNTFTDCDNCTHLYFPGTTGWGGGSSLAFSRFDGLLKFNAEATASLLRRGWLSSSALLKKLDLRACASMSTTYNMLTGLTGLERLYIGALTSFGTDDWLQNGETFFENLNGSCVVYYNSAVGVADRQAFGKLVVDTGGIDVADVITINGLAYTAISGTPSTDGEFDVSSGATTDITNLRNAINTDGRTGTSGTVTAVSDARELALYVDYTGVAGNSTQLEHTTGTSGITLTAFKGGNDLHSVLIYLRDVQGCTMRQVNVITQDPPTALSFSSLTATTVDLDFTAPAANANGLEGYEVWVDDGGIYTKLFEYTEITASGDTVDLSEFGSLSGLKIKIRAFDNHFNFSTFSNEITLP